MALEVLYGPVNVQAGGISAASAAGFMWLQGIGLLAVLDLSSAFNLYAVQMDGTAKGPRSGYNGSGFAPVLDLRNVRGLAVATVTDLYNFNWLVGQPDTLSLLHGSACYRINVITADRYVGFFDSGAGMQAQATHDGTMYVSEYTFTSPSAGTLKNVSRGRSTTEVCLAFYNGQVRFYDLSLKVQNGPTLFVGEAPDGCWYVPKWDVFVELLSLQVKILADATAPATLSNPIALTNTDLLGDVIAGRIAELQVQLLGAQSEPCIGELINWSVTSGVGLLTAPQSTTDDNGYATTGLIIPIGGTGTTAVSATLDY